MLMRNFDLYCSFENDATLLVSFYIKDRVSRCDKTGKENLRLHGLIRGLSKSVFDKKRIRNRNAIMFLK